MSNWLTTLASFTRPEHLGTTPTSLLWLVPLTVSIATVYKATKVVRIDRRRFPREVLSLFGSILVFIVIAALILVAISWLINDRLGAG